MELIDKTFEKEEIISALMREIRDLQTFASKNTNRFEDLSFSLVLIRENFKNDKVKIRVCNPKEAKKQKVKFVERLERVIELLKKFK